MPLIFNPIRKQFLCADWPYRLRDEPRKAGFQWSPSAKIWHTTSVYKAYTLREYATGEAAARLARVHYNIESSSAAEPVFEPGNGLYPFQAAGVEELVERYRAGRRYLLLCDDAGLGKSAQSLCFADCIGASRLLVIAPASLRLNWVREIEMWHYLNPGTQALLKGKQEIDPELSVITSYALAKRVKKEKFDMVIVDELHALQSITAQRTKIILKEEGLIADTPALFLSGTPLPGGKPSQLYPILNRCAPDVIDNDSYYSFIRKFCVVVENDFGGPVIMGAKNQDEFYTRLRGSGLMVRRLKKDVLKDLPEKQFKLIVFPADGGLSKVIKKEKDFDPNEIIRHGVPVGSALPELRREMGVAKLPLCIGYIKGMLEDGVEKIVVFGHHIEVVKEIAKVFNGLLIYGGTSAAERQQNVDRFQNDPSVKVIVGNSAMAEGLTLTAAAHIVKVEFDYTPGNEDQRNSRIHRIGQKERVMIHHLVVEGSLDAKIMLIAAKKMQDINQTIDGASNG